MRNGDFVPTRMQAQQDAVNLVCMSKTRSNPENNVGLLKMSSVEVLVTLTTDVGRILARLHQVQPKGNISFLNGVRVAHLALKHRQGRNHKMRIVAFVGSPIEEDEKEIIKVAKKLKKEKVNVDVINFGEEGLNTDKLTTFVNTLNGKDGTSSHLVTVPPGPMLSDALLSSPVIVGEDGSGAPMSGGFEFGVDPNEDPELALALRVSMEEQRARQEKDAREAVTASVAESTNISTASPEEALLEKALGVTSATGDAGSTTATPSVDFSNMTEDEQIAYALRLSMENSGTEETASAPMEVETTEGATATEEKKEEEDFSEVMQDPAFLQSVLENLPGVDPNSEAIKDAMKTLTSDSPKDAKDKDQPKKEGKK
ncbi:26S proteasome non-ATPase regulatory subunit 4-like isoform X2 [Babylonia areolata]